jgi:carbon monoxide dehydrogenase subunit G
MAKLQISTRVDAPTAELFDLLADPMNEAAWNPDVVEVRRVDEGPLAVGAVWEGRYRAMGTMQITLVDCERPTRLAFSVSGSRLAMEMAFAFAPEGPATRLDAIADVRTRGMMRVLSPLIGPIMRRTFRRRPEQMAAGVAAQSH